MPNRLIKESVCTSDKINTLSDFNFRVWAYLITYVDDYGRGDARPAIIKGRCFPLRDNVSINDITEGLKALSEAGCILLYTVDDSPYLCFPNWDKHQSIRNHKSKYPAPSEADCKQLNSIEINCNQLKSDASKCHRNPIQSESLSESLSLSKPLIDDDDAHKIQSEQNRVMDAAEDAGFKMSNDVRANLISLYSEYGLQKMLDGFKACVDHGALNLAYLRAVLKGEKKSAKPIVAAQDFKQRDYSGVESEMMQSLSKEMAEFKAQQGVS